MFVPQVPSTTQQTKARLWKTWLLYGKAKIYQKGLFRANANLHGPTKAIPMANNDPKSCPRVAPAPINPNNLEPDWTQSMLGPE